MTMEEEPNMQIEGVNIKEKLEELFEEEEISDLQSVLDDDGMRRLVTLLSERQIQALRNEIWGDLASKKVILMNNFHAYLKGSPIRRDRMMKDDTNQGDREGDRRSYHSEKWLSQSPREFILEIDEACEEVGFDAENYWELWRDYRKRWEDGESWGKRLSLLKLPAFLCLLERGYGSYDLSG